MPSEVCGRHVCLDIPEQQSRVPGKRKLGYRGSWGLGAEVCGHDVRLDVPLQQRRVPGMRKLADHRD